LVAEFLEALGLRASCSRRCPARPCGSCGSSQRVPPRHGAADGRRPL